jgi:DNA primase
VLEGAGYTEAEIEASGVLADSRWPGRLCGAWRDDYGRIGTLWARTLNNAEDAGSRYLYLRGAARTNLPPYGLRDALASDRRAPRELVLVEGLLDVHQLRARGIENIAALGGTAIRAQAFEPLHRRGLETVTLCLDNDEAGRVATRKAIEQSARAQESPVLYVVDPARLAPAKDPDALVRGRGVGAWHELLSARTCGIEWRAQELVGGVSRDSSAAERRDALARAGRWLGKLPPRLALEQEDGLSTVAATCGYSVPAVRRAFQTHFFREQTIERAKPAPRLGRQPAERAIER